VVTDRADPKELQEQPHTTGHRGDTADRLGGAGRHVVERLARDQREPCHPLVPGKAFSEQELGTAPVVDHERDLAQVEPAEELPEQAGHPELGEIGVRPHWYAVTAERQRGQHAAVPR